MPGQDSEHIVVATGRAFGGALLFSIPLLMTMEMWWLGFYVSPLRLALFLLAAAPLLVGLSHYSGFEKTFNWKQDLADAMAALAIGALTAAAMLSVFGMVTAERGPSELLGMIAIQTVPAGIGAMVARQQFGGQQGGDEDRPGSYAGELFLMAVGALYLGFNVAPTEEMILIAYRMTPVHGMFLIALSLLVLHSFVYAVGFRGQHGREKQSHLDLFLHFTLGGYAVAALVSLYVLWTFGRLDGVGLEELTGTVVVLGFPGSIGAAVSRLIV